MAEHKIHLQMRYIQTYKPCDFLYLSALTSPIDGAGSILYYVKSLPALPTTHVDANLSPCCITSNLILY